MKNHINYNNFATVLRATLKALTNCELTNELDDRDNGSIANGRFVLKYKNQQLLWFETAKETVTELHGVTGGEFPFVPSMLFKDDFKPFLSKDGLQRIVNSITSRINAMEKRHEVLVKSQIKKDYIATNGCLPLKVDGNWLGLVNGSGNGKFSVFFREQENIGEISPFDDFIRVVELNGIAMIFDLDFYVIKQDFSKNLTTPMPMVKVENCQILRNRASADFYIIAEKIEVLSPNSIADNV